MVGLVGCTSQESKIEKLAVELGERKFQEVLTQEASDGITQSGWLRTAYVDYMSQNAEVLVSEVQFHGENQATAVVVVKTYSPPMRRTLAEIAGGIDQSKTRRFNFGEAISLIGKQMGKKPEKTEHPLTTFKFNKTSAGTWVPQF